jgi:predicted phosphodiesterase
MICAIVSDIHANYEALSCVLQYLKEIDIQDIVCCGDIVGYGPNPIECIDALKEFKLDAVRGNHDQAFLTDTIDIYFNEDAVVALNIQKSFVHRKEIEFVKSLPSIKRRQNFTFTHSFLDTLHPYKYVLDEKSALADADLNTKNNILFIGHSHVPQVYEITKDRVVSAHRAHNGIDWQLEPENKYVINVGSVGQSRDGNPDCSFALFDTTAMLLKILRFPYPIYKTQKKMKEKGFPDFLIKRLSRGI